MGSGTIIMYSFSTIVELGYRWLVIDRDFGDFQVNYIHKQFNSPHLTISSTLVHSYN